MRRVKRNIMMNNKLFTYFMTFNSILIIRTVEISQHSSARTVTVLTTSENVLRTVWRRCIPIMI